MSSLKEEFLKLLEKDLEFRYAVAGYLGILEVLKRLDTIAEGQARIWNEIERIWGEIERIWNEIRGLKEEQVKLREEQIKLREDFNRAFQAMDVRLTRVERTLEKLTVDVEDEARSIIRYRIRKELGLDIELGSLILPDLEINIYGAADDLCVIGEATVRGGVGVLEKLLEKAELLRNRYPDRLRPKTIMVIYASLALPELVEEAKKRGIWLLKATEDYYKPDLTTLT